MSNLAYVRLSLLVAWVGFWIVAALPALLGALGAILLSGYFISTFKTRLRRIGRTYSQRMNAQPLAFAPIDSPVAASLAAQITSTMTIQDIEDIVNSQVNREGFHSRMNKIER